MQRKLTFPILYTPESRNFLEDSGLFLIESIPYDMLYEHVHQVVVNHKQHPDQLSQKGGLSPSEVVACLNDRPWQEMPLIKAQEALRRLLEDFEGRGSFVIQSLRSGNYVMHGGYGFGMTNSLDFATRFTEDFAQEYLRDEVTPIEDFEVKDILTCS